MVKVGVIGLGNMGKNHARVYTELEEAELVAVADVNKELEESAGKSRCKFYADYRKMLEKEDIEALSIAVPTKLHRSIALECIEQGKDILIEKPIASTIEEAQEIVKAGERKKSIVMVGHVERFNPAVRKLKEMIKGKKFGKIISISARRVGIFPPQIKDANVILDLAVHDIDVFNYLLEKKPGELYAKAGKALVNHREDNASIFLSYGNISCMLQVNWITPVKIRELAVTGTKRYAELNYILQELKVYESVYEKSYDSFGDFIFKFGKPNEIEVEFEKEEPLKAELKHFLGCVENRREPMVSGKDALSALYISLKAIESYRKNRKINLCVQ